MSETSALTHRLNFRQFYNHTIHPELVRMDRERLRSLRLAVALVILSIGVIVFGIYVRILLVTMLLSLVLILLASYVLWRFKKFKDTFKPRVVKLVLDFMDDDLLFGELRYFPNGKISKERFLSSGIFTTTADLYEGEDYITGRIGDVRFELCELLVRETSRVRARLDDVFQGVFIHAVFNHPARGILLVFPRKDMPRLIESVRNFVAHGGICLDDKIKTLLQEACLRLGELEQEPAPSSHQQQEMSNLRRFIRCHERFLDVFTVYGSRLVRITNLLPEELMCFLADYSRKTENLYISILGRHMYVAISSQKDILEPRYFRSNVNFDVVSEFYDDISAALQIVQAIDRSH